MTERLVVLLEPQEKASLKSAAAAAQVSMGEYVKRAVASYDARADAEVPGTELEMLATQLAEAAARMSARLDHSVARIDAMLDPSREAAQRQRLEAEARLLPDAAIDGIAALFGVRTPA